MLAAKPHVRGLMNYVFERLLLFAVFLAFFQAVRPYQLLHSQPRWGVVVVPVANVINRPFPDSDPYSILRRYQTLDPKEPGDDPIHERRYQLLFNERVELVARKNHQYKVKIPHILHHFEKKGIIQDYYWVHENAIMPLDTLEAYDVNTQLFPPLIIHGDCDVGQILAHTVVLVMPFMDPKTGRTFSAGTRFVKVQEGVQADDQAVAVYYFDPTTKNFGILSIPIDILVTFSFTPSIEQRVEHFLKLVRTWANLPQGYIPYVWGGSSFVGVVRNDTHDPVRESGHSSVHVHALPESFHGVFGYGFDCSCLISRAALASGLPYYLGNSTLIAYFSKPLGEHDAIKNGDIFWFPGHVMIVSDVEKNLIIEARGYGAGFGRVHEVPLHRVFKGIRTYSDLQRRYVHTQPIMLLNSDGTDRRLLQQYAIYNFTNSWVCPERK